MDRLRALAQRLYKWGIAPDLLPPGKLPQPERPQEPEKMERD